MGEPCKHGHGRLRYKSGGDCVECVRQYDKDHAEDKRQYGKQWHKDNAEYDHQYRKDHAEENLRKSAKIDNNFEGIYADT